MWMPQRMVPERLSAQYFVGFGGRSQQLGAVAAIMARCRRRAETPNRESWKVVRYVVIETACSTLFKVARRFACHVATQPPKRDISQHAGAVGDHPCAAANAGSGANHA
jgi:hypothetical protein